MIKLIVSDLDNTLLSEDHKSVSIKNKEAIRFAKEKGALFAIATGRTRALVDPIIQDLQMVDYLIYANGAGVVDLETGKSFVKGLTYSQLEDLVELHEKYGAIYEIYADGSPYIFPKFWDKFDSKDMNEDYVNALKIHLKPIENLEELKRKEIEKINSIFVREMDELKKAVRQLGEFSITSSTKENIEITAPRIDKGRALAYLAKWMGLDKREIAVFGDSMNDFSMMAWCPNSFAMGNGREEIKRISKYEMPPYNEDGVAEGIYQIFK